MKDDLKTFPKEKDFMQTSNVGSFEPLECLEAIYEWKNRVEKELQQLKETLHYSNEPLENLKNNLIDGFLGVSEK